MSLEPSSRFYRLYVYSTADGIIVNFFMLFLYKKIGNDSVMRHVWPTLLLPDVLCVCFLATRTKTETESSQNAQSGGYALYAVFVDTTDDFLDFFLLISFFFYRPLVVQVKQSVRCVCLSQRLGQRQRQLNDF